jgi:hypothetical protein
MKKKIGKIPSTTENDLLPPAPGNYMWLYFYP